MIKMKELIKQQNDIIRKETGMIKEDKVPSDIKMIMDKLVKKLEDKKLPRQKKKAVIVGILKALNISAKELSMYIGIVKKEL